MADLIGMTKGDVAGVIGAQAGPTHRDPMAIAFEAGKIENITHDYIFIGVVRPHPISRMNRFIVETFQINRVRAINGDFAVIDEPLY